MVAKVGVFQVQSRSVRGVLVLLGRVCSPYQSRNTSDCSGAYGSETGEGGWRIETGGGERGGEKDGGEGGCQSSSSHHVN